MDIGSILLILALLILVALFVSRPFFERGLAPANARTRQDDHDLSALLAEHDRILNALQELDFDHALGKIPEEDYPAQRALLLQRGANILRRLDELQTGQATNDAEARLEEAIAARRADARSASNGFSSQRGESAQTAVAQAATVAEADDELEVLLANRRRVRREKSAGFCPQCGGPIQQSDKFCPKCGAKVA